jgi:hypothetical protein
MDGAGVLMTTPQQILDFGVTTVLIALVLSVTGYYLMKILPGDRQYQRKLTETIVEQVSLSRQALETSNEVIRMNSSEMKDNRLSHSRIWGRLGSLEAKVERHDERAEEIAKDTQAIRTKLGC